MKIQGIEIKWLGHSAFKIKTEGKTIYIDPFQIKEAKNDANYILITHPHYDHCSQEDIQKVTKEGTKIIMPTDCQSKVTRIATKVQMIVTALGEKRKIENIEIEAVPAYNTNKEFHKKEQQWIGYILTINNKRIYHAGDTDNIPEIKNLKNIDIALLPVSGTYVMTAEEAADAAAVIRPKVAIPMHYGTIVGNESDADGFVALCKEKGIEADKLK